MNTHTPSAAAITELIESARHAMDLLDALCLCDNVLGQYAIKAASASLREALARVQGGDVAV